jgi:hypothetical protein
MPWAIRPMRRPSPAVTSSRFRCTIGRSHSASERITHPRRAPITPITKAHAKLANVGDSAGGTECRTSEKVPRPVHWPRPTKTNAPMPEASRPGNITRLSVIPPIPAISMIRKAASTGEPSSVLIAAKLPADAMIITAIGGASFFARRTVNAASPAPIAISGASGPSTAPRPSVVNAASAMPGSSRPVNGAPPVLKPNAGEWPPLPGS